MKISRSVDLSRPRTGRFRSFARGSSLAPVSEWTGLAVSRSGEAAFSLVEVLMGMSILALVTVSMYAGISFGFASITLARQNLRATQIALEKMEIVRMYSWDQINSNGFVPATFTAPFFPMATGGDTNGGMIFYGVTTITNFSKNVSYGTDMRLVTVTLNWTNRNLAQTLQMSTYISQYGMQRYIY
jgi:hypothetical protein